MRRVLRGLSGAGALDWEALSGTRFLEGEAREHVAPQLWPVGVPWTKTTAVPPSAQDRGGSVREVVVTDDGVALGVQERA